MPCIFWRKLGKTEATWVYEVERFGPFFVDIDAHGHNYFETLDADMRARLKTTYADLGIPESFAYTRVNPEGKTA